MLKLPMLKKKESHHCDPFPLNIPLLDILNVNNYRKLPNAIQRYKSFIINYLFYQLSILKSISNGEQ